MCLHRISQGCHSNTGNIYIYIICIIFRELWYALVVCSRLQSWSLVFWYWREARKHYPAFHALVDMLKHVETLLSDLWLTRFAIDIHISHRLQQIPGLIWSSHPSTATRLKMLHCYTWEAPLSTHPQVMRQREISGQTGVKSLECHPHLGKILNLLFQLSDFSLATWNLWMTSWHIWHRCSRVASWRHAARQRSPGSGGFPKRSLGASSPDRGLPLWEGEQTNTPEHQPGNAAWDAWAECEFGSDWEFGYMCRMLLRIFEIFKGFFGAEIFGTGTVSYIKYYGIFRLWTAKDRDAWADSWHIGCDAMPPGINVLTSVWSPGK